MYTNEIEAILEESLGDLDFIRDIVSEINAVDGSLINTEATFWPMSKLPAIIKEWHNETAYEIVEAARDGMFDPDHKYFYYDEHFNDGWASTDEPNMNIYIPHIATWLVEHYSTKWFPQWLENEKELMDAIYTAKYK